MNGPALATDTLAWTVGLLLPLTVALAVMSALLERSGPIRLRHWAEEAGGRLRALYDQPVRFGVFRSLLSLGARLVPVGLCLALAALLQALGRAGPWLWSFGVVALLLALAEMGNRTLVWHGPEEVLRSLTFLYRGALLICWLPVALLAPLVPVAALDRRDEDDDDETVSDEEIEAFIDVGTREGILEPQEGEMLWSMVEFGDTQVRSVMTPRIDMVCAAIDTSLDALAERFVESGHSRLPIYEESIDRVAGVLHIRDLLRALRSAEPPAVRELLKPPLFVPETKPLGELLKELQARFQQLAIVVDEYGGTAGIVTVEDLVEEIVGEIMDEHDALVAELEPLEGGAYRLDGRAHIDLLEELFQIDIEDPEYETVAGLIFTELGHVPLPGEIVELQGLRFTVEAVADRRIEKVLIEKIVPEAAEEAG